VDWNKGVFCMNKKEYNKKYYKEHRNEMAEYHKKYREKHKDGIAEYHKKYREEHRNEMLAYYKQWYETYRNEILAHKKQWRKTHKNEISAHEKQWREQNKDRWHEIAKKHNSKRKRSLGFVCLNKPFEGSDAHHICPTFVIYIPREMHKSIYHNVWTGKNMDKINKLAFDYLLGVKENEK